LSAPPSRTKRARCTGSKLDSRTIFATVPTEIATITTAANHRGHFGRESALLAVFVLVSLLSNAVPLLGEADV
jgi:hypothetical protein